jgi:ATP-dependent DNA helicase RecG
MLRDPLHTKIINILNKAAYTTQDLYNIVAQGKGPDLHWFQEDVSLSLLAASFVAMANTSGGTVLLGVSPRSGQVLGVQKVAHLRDRIFQAALLADPPLILPLPTVQKINQTHVLWITVPAGLPNVYSIEGRYLWREGIRNTPIPARRLRQLLLERGALQFETQIPPGATMNDLDMSRVSAYVEGLHLPPTEGVEKDFNLESQVLLQRGCLQIEGGELRPTYAALLLFGYHPQRWLPAATILAARFLGDAFGDRYIKKDIVGTLPEQLNQAELFVRSNLRSVVRLVGLRHQETLEYPIEAVRELMVNAVAHRDYNLQGDCIHLNIFSDRLEVTSPGELPGPVTLQNLLEARFSRNAVVVQVLADMGFVERLGYGLERVVNLMAYHGMQQPRFEERAGTFRVTLLGKPSLEAAKIDPARYAELDLNPRQQRALTYLAKHQRITNSEYQTLCPDVHPETLRRDLVDLVKSQVLIKIGDKRGTYYIFK